MYVTISSEGTKQLSTSIGKVPACHSKHECSQCISAQANACTIAHSSEPWCCVCNIPHSTLQYIILLLPHMQPNCYKHVRKMTIWVCNKTVSLETNKAVNSMQRLTPPRQKPSVKMSHSTPSPQRQSKARQMAWESSSLQTKPVNSQCWAGTSLCSKTASLKVVLLDQIGRPFNVAEKPQVC